MRRSISVSTSTKIPVITINRGRSFWGGQGEWLPSTCRLAKLLTHFFFKKREPYLCKALEQTSTPLSHLRKQVSLPHLCISTCIRISVSISVSIACISMPLAHTHGLRVLQQYSLHPTPYTLKSTEMVKGHTYAGDRYRHRYTYRYICRCT